MRTQPSPIRISLRSAPLRFSAVQIQSGEGVVPGEHEETREDRVEHGDAHLKESMEFARRNPGAVSVNHRGERHCKCK